MNYATSIKNQLFTLIDEMDTSRWYFVKNPTKAYKAEDIQKLLDLKGTKTYEFLAEVYEKQDPFRVIKIGKGYRIPCKSFDKWFYGE